MRVCHVITGLLEHGAERMLAKTSIALRSLGIESSVISLMPVTPLADEMIGSGIRVYSLNLSRGRANPSSIYQLSKLIREIDPDILQGWMYHGNLAATLGAITSLSRAPVIWNIRQTLYELANEKRLTRAVIRLSSATSSQPKFIIYNSSLSARQHEKHGFPPAKSIFIPNGFDTHLFSPKKTPEILMGVPSFNSHPFTIGLAARFHPMKDLHTFFRAARIVANNKPNVRFRVAGAGLDQSNTELLSLINEEGVSEKVELLGKQTNMVDFYRSLDALALTSAWGEAFPNVLGEAMSCGIPCVSTDVGDAANIIGKTGFIVPARSPEKLAGCLMQLIDDSPTSRTTRKLDSREKVIQNYSLPTIAAQYAELYRSVLGSIHESAKP